MSLQFTSVNLLSISFSYLQEFRILECDTKSVQTLVKVCVYVPI